MVDSGNLSASWHCPNSWGNTEKRWLEMLHQNLPTNESKLLKESYHCWQILLYYENPALVGKQMNSLICKWKQCVPCQDRRADRADAQEHTHICNASAWVVESSFPFFFTHCCFSLWFLWILANICMQSQGKHTLTKITFGKLPTAGHTGKVPLGRKSMLDIGRKLNVGHRPNCRLPYPYTFWPCWTCL